MLLKNSRDTVIYGEKKIYANLTPATTCDTKFSRFFFLLFKRDHHRTQARVELITQKTLYIHARREAAAANLSDGAQLAAFACVRKLYIYKLNRGEKKKMWRSVSTRGHRRRFILGNPETWDFQGVR